MCEKLLDWVGCFFFLKVQNKKRFRNIPTRSVKGKRNVILQYPAFLYLFRYTRHKNTLSLFVDFIKGRQIDPYLCINNVCCIVTQFRFQSKFQKNESYYNQEALLTIPIVSFVRRRKT